MASRNPVRSAIVKLTIASFSIAALLGVIALIGGGEFGDTQVRVLLTTLLVGVVSIAVLCYLSTGGTPFQAVGAFGGLVVLVPLVTAMLMIWGDTDNVSDGVLKTFGVGSIVAGTVAQVCLLLALAARKGRTIKILLGLTLVVATLLAVILSVLVLGAEAGDALARIIGIIAIFDVLGTIVVAALSKFGPERDSGDAGHDGDTIDIGQRVSLPAELVAELDRRAAATGRRRDDVAAEAIARAFTTHPE